MKKALWKGQTLKTQDAIAGSLFFSPWIIGFLIFTAYPMVYSILLSLNEVVFKPGYSEFLWRGLFYYDHALNVDTSFRLDLGSTVLMIVCATPVIMVFALIIALLLNGSYRGRSFFRAVFFLPVIIMSGPVVSKLLTGHSVDFSTVVPQISEFLQSMPSVLSTPVLYVLDNLVLIFWFSGVQILLFLSGLHKINPSLYEAAEIDGAGGWEKFWKITLPHMQPMLLIGVIYTIVDLANYSKNDVNVKIAKHLFDKTGQYSFSAAMSWLYFVVEMLIIAAACGILAFFGRSKKE